MRYKGKRIAVLGLGVEGRDVVRFLLKECANVTIFEKKGEKELDFAGIDNKKIKLVCGKNYLKKGFRDYLAVFRSPGVYRYLPELVEAENRGIKISSATQLFFDLCPAKIIGVTGTKGKGTTVTLIYEILKKSGKDVHLAGNIGQPVLELLPRLKNTSWVILELSSFQLIDSYKSPNIAVVLNITEDHLDWHKDKSEYINAKKNIVKHQVDTDFAAINYDYKVARDFGKITKAERYYFSRRGRVDGSYVKEGVIYLNTQGKIVEIGEVLKLKLRGRHNWENVCAAVCASYLAGATITSIKQSTFSFKGLEHRLELVRKIKGISFYNDSFSTNPQTTMAAIDSFVEPITLILGGSDKGLNYSILAKVIAESKNIKSVCLMGQIGSIIGDKLGKANFEGNIIDLGKRSMNRIVSESLKVTSRGEVVLLSPAAASFDMFENYKDRGNQFKKAVNKL